MRRSQDAWALRIGPCVATWLLLLSSLALGAGPERPPEAEGLAASASSLVDQIGAPRLPPAPAPAQGAPGSKRSQLTGDWAGARDILGEHGLTFFGDATQYYQGVAVGGLAQQFKYGGRGDYLLDLDSQKAGLWDGGRLDLRGETRLGQDCNGIDGAVAPSNFAMALPLPGQNETALTGVQYTHTVSDNLSVFCGKLDLLDGTPTSYARGMRLNYFWNAAMQSNLSRAYLFPSTLGAGLTLQQEGEPVFNFYLLDTHYTPTTSGFSTLFSNGVVLYGEYRRRTNWFELPGHTGIGLLYSNATRTVLGDNPYLVLPGLPPGQPLPTRDSAWTVLYRFDQILIADTKNPAHNWTLSGDYGLTDGNPNPIHWFANLSLVGSSPFLSRENDTCGIGYYHLGVSTVPVLTALGLGAENGVELFYNAAVTPWFHVTPDLQILDPAQRRTETAILVGLRARLSF